MVKKGVMIFALAFIFLIIIATIAMAQETEVSKVKKAYAWLTTKVKTRSHWDSLNVQEHAFTLLALQSNGTYTEPGNHSLYKKAWIGPPTSGTCWGKQAVVVENNCRITETALAKLAIDKIGLADTEDVSTWIINQSSFFKNLYWFLELDVERDFNASCLISYGGGNTTLNINKNKTLTLTGLSGIPCFDVHEDYWLKIETTCFEKSFKIKCIVFDKEGKPAEGEDFRISLHYKKSLDPADPWYTSTGSQKIASGKWSDWIVLQSYCLVNPGETDCDYEGTALATYALKENSEEYTDFIPYLIISKENNEKYLPEALLYLTGVDRYGKELEQLQNPPGFWKAENTMHGQFYDTALAGLTELGNLSSEEGGARYYLTVDCDRMHTFKETADKKYRYWECTETGCKDLKDTAFLLWVFWPELCPGIAAEGCEEQGYLCKDECTADDIPIPTLDDTCFFGQVCCKLGAVFECVDKGGVCKTSWCDADEFELDIACESIWDVCCKKYSDATCNETGGEICEEGYKCKEEEIEVKDTDKCCLGICVKEGEYEYCSEVPGINCYDNEVCVNPDTRSLVPFVNTTFDDRCCPYEGTCVVESCKAANGRECKADEVCSVSVIETADIKECCTGECRAMTCEDLGGEICGKGEVCEKGKEISIGCCKSGYCKKKTSLWWLWLLIIVIIAAGILLYFYKFKKPKKKKKPPFGMPPTMPARRPLMPIRRMPPTAARPVPARAAPARPIPKPVARGKTEAELEKTLKKLKGMAKK